MTTTVCNLDDFKSFKPVTLEGTEYRINQFSVGDYIDDTIGLGKVETAKTTSEKAAAMVEIAKEVSNIPEDVLRKQPIDVIKAIILLAQNVDPTSPARNPTAG